MKKVTKNEVKNWIQSNKKKLIIGGSVIAGTAAVYFGGKALLDNDKISAAITRKLIRYRIYRHGYCCSVFAAWSTKGITEEQANQIIDEAVKKFEEIYQAAGIIE